MPFPWSIGQHYTDLLMMQMRQIYFYIMSRLSTSIGWIWILSGFEGERCGHSQSSIVQSLMGFKVSISASRWSMLHELGKCRESHSWSLTFENMDVSSWNWTLGGHLYICIFQFHHMRNNILSNILNKLYAFNNCFVDHSVIVLRAEKNRFD